MPDPLASSGGDHLGDPTFHLSHFRGGGLLLLLLVVGSLAIGGAPGIHIRHPWALGASTLQELHSGIFVKLR